MFCILFAAINLQYYVFEGGQNLDRLSDVENPHNFNKLCVDPGVDTGIDLKNTISTLTDSDKIKFAVDTYNYAANYAKNTDYFMTYASGIVYVHNSITGDGIVVTDNVIMKTQEEYYKGVYKFADDFPLLKDKLIGPIVIAFTDTILGERMYANSSSTKLGYQKIRNTYVKEDGQPASNWSKFKNSNIVYKELPNFNSNCEDIYRFTNQNFTYDTIKSVDISFDEKDENLVTINYVWDLENPDGFIYSRPDIIEGTEDPNAKFTTVEIKITYFNNGLFCSFYSDERFEAHKALPILGDLEIKMKLLTTGYFSYFAHDCDFSKYEDAIEAREALPIQ